MKKVYWLIALSGLLFVGTVSGSGRTDPQPSNPILLPDDEQSFQPTVVLQCEIVEIFEDNRRIMVRDSKTGEKHLLLVDDGVGIKARHKKDFDGRRKLAFRDFVVGQMLNVTLEADTMRPLKIRVLDPGAA